MEAFEEVSDSLCVPQYNSDGEERVILFLKMGPNKSFSQELVGKIRSAIRVALSARHIPALIMETKDIPVSSICTFILCVAVPSLALFSVLFHLIDFHFLRLQYTISGKKVEVAVKQVIAGKDVTQRGAFSNPDSLDLYKNLPELQNF